jgi:hypothetical protein
VRSQHWLDDSAGVPPEELVNALEREVKMKLEGNSRRLGF